MSRQDPNPEEESVFEDALSVPDGPTRELLIAQRCAGNPSLAERVLALIRGFESSHDLDQPLGTVFDRISAIPSLVGSQVGRFEVLEFLGEGGMGEVYIARDTQRPGNLVAIKVIKAGMDSRQFIARFELERQALRQLNHPHIASWIDAGSTADQRPFVAMELVRGLSITEYCDREQLSVHDRIRLLLDVCSAVEHAHRQGLVHRDLKPTNMLVTRQNDRAIVKVIDFGVAKVCDSKRLVDTRYTMATHWVGTPCYISPEQARWSMDVDERTDLYSLGVILYELCTGTTPLDPCRIPDMDLDTLRQAICEEETGRPSCYLSGLSDDQALGVARRRSTDPVNLVRTLRRDLDWVILKTLEKHRDSRYPTIHDFASDLRAVLENRAPQAGPPSVLVRFGRWSRRQRRWLSLAGMLVASIGIAYGISSLVRERNAAGLREQTLAAEKKLAEQKNDSASFAFDIRSAAMSVASQNQAAARTLLSKWRQPDNSLRRRFVLNYLWTLTREPQEVSRPHHSNLTDMDMSVHGRWIATSDRQGDIVLWDRLHNREANRMHPGDGEISCVRFSPDGKQLATAGSDQIVRLWDVASSSLLGELNGHDRPILGLTWSPDGNRLASSDAAAIVRIWDTQKRTLHHTLPIQDQPVTSLAWSPDGQYLATTEGTHGVHVWHTNDWSHRSFHEKIGGAIMAVAFSPDSRCLAYCGLGDVVAFSFLHEQDQIQRIPTHADAYSITFSSPTEAFLGNSRGSVEVYQYSYAKGMWENSRQSAIGPPPNIIRSIAVGAGGDVYAATEHDGRVRAIPRSVLSDRADQELLAAVPIPPLALSNLELRSCHNEQAHEYRRIDDGRVAVRTQTLVDIRVLPVFCESHRWIANVEISGNADRLLRVYDTRQGKMVRQWPLSHTIGNLSFSRDGRYLAAAGSPDGQVIIHDLQTSESRPLPDINGSSPALARFSPHHDLLVAGSINTRELICFDAVSLQPIRKTVASSEWGAFEFFPRAALLVVSQNDGISVWNADLSRQQWFAHGPPSGRTSGIQVAISEDESTVVTLRESLQFFDSDTRSLLFETPCTLRADNWMSFLKPRELWTMSSDGVSRLLATD